jgi:uncharacterized protein (TIGR03083 family)
VQAAGSDPVWAFGEMRPASFWARRMAHETAVHRADAEIAVGRTPDLAPELAADAIDERLGMLSGAIDVPRPDPTRALTHCRPAGPCMSTPPTTAWTEPAS